LLDPSRDTDAFPIEGCPIRNVLDRIGDRWSVLVMLMLEDGDPVRFSVLKRRIGDISQRMLAQTLRRLEQDGFLVRTVHATVPPQVDYALTELGRSFRQPLSGLVAWADAHQEAVLAARAAYVPPPRQPAL
jgi:DNA-binding HxlR family transcriptional regulator